LQLLNKDFIHVDMVKYVEESRAYILSFWINILTEILWKISHKSVATRM